MNSAMGERQMLPKQMKRTFIIVLFTPCFVSGCSVLRGFIGFWGYSKFLSVNYIIGISLHILCISQPCVVVKW